MIFIPKIYIILSVFIINKCVLFLCVNHKLKFLKTLIISVFYLCLGRIEGNKITSWIVS